MPFSIIVAGAVAMIAQAVFLREILATFRGGELTIGTALLGWLLWTAIGSGPVSRMLSRTAKPDILFHRLLPWQGVLAFSGILIIRNVPILTGLSAGEVVPYDSQFIAVLLAFAPSNIIGGLLFVLGARSLGAEERTAVGSAFTLEGIGSAAAGIVVSLLVIPFLSNTGVALLCPALGTGTGVAWFIRKHNLRSVAFMILPVLVLGMAVLWSHETEGIQYRGQELLAETDTRYGRLRATRAEEQITCYADADVAFSVPDLESAEYAVHIPMLSAPPAKRVLVLGGSPGGIIDEVLKYPTIEQVTCVELDPALFTFADRFLPQAWGTDARIVKVSSDGRAWLSRTEDMYDVIILSMPAPLSGTANRYYTREFFTLAADRLTGNGVIGFSLLGDENYLSDDLAFFLASIRSTLNVVFPAVATLPGVKCRFIASKMPEMFDTFSWESLEANRRELGIETHFVRDYYLSTLLSPLRIRSLAATLDAVKSPAVNTDTRPSGYFSRTVIQGGLDGSQTVRLMRQLLTPDPLWLVMALFLFTAALAAFFPGKSAGRTIAATVISVGLTEISLEVLAIMAYQSVFGFLYGRIALLTGSYMGGLALGGWLGTRLVKNGRATMKHLAIIQAGIALLPVCWTLLLGLHAALPGQFPVLELLFYVLTLCAGTAGGSQFPVAENIHRGLLSYRAYSPGTIYSLDLAGSSVGALLMASLMVPVLGMMPVLGFLAILNAITASAVWLRRNAV